MHGDAAVRLEAFKALEIMATEKEAEPLVRLLCKTPPGPERRNSFKLYESLAFSELILEHILDEHPGANTLQIPFAALGKANTICQLATVFVVARHDFNQTLGVKAVNCRTGTIWRNPHALGKRFA